MARRDAYLKRGVSACTATNREKVGDLKNKSRMAPQSSGCTRPITLRRRSMRNLPPAAVTAAKTFVLDIVACGVRPANQQARISALDPPSRASDWGRGDGRPAFWGPRGAQSPRPARPRWLNAFFKIPTAWKFDCGPHEGRGAASGFDGRFFCRRSWADAETCKAQRAHDYRGAISIGPAGWRLGVRPLGMVRWAFVFSVTDEIPFGGPRRSAGFAADRRRLPVCAASMRRRTAAAGLGHHVRADVGPRCQAAILSRARR